MKRRWIVSLSVMLAALMATAAPTSSLQLDLSAVVEAVPLVLRAIEINRLANERERRHEEELRKKGVAEVAASTSALRYRIDPGGLGAFLFDEWGELYIDRRFVTDDEMKVVHQIEAYVAKWFPLVAKKFRAHAPRRTSGGAGLPVFRGFEDARYQQHDQLINRLVKEFNGDKAKWCGGTPEQAAKIANLTPALVKSHMIEESGGNAQRSRDAWAVDPLQVNVPGDWDPEKESLGLSKPVKRNEGDLETNVKAAIMYLVRKGFSPAAAPASKRPKGFFDGWRPAMQRYNGRRDRTDTDRYYSDEYADKIILRAENPDKFVPIEIKLGK